MGMSASQARLLTITARMHDVEYAAQSIQDAKLALATQEDQIYQNYLDALDETTFTVKDNNGNRMVANFNSLCGIDAVKANKSTRYVLRDDHNRIIVSDDIYEAFKEFGSGGDPYLFAMYMMTGQKSNWNDLPSEDGSGKGQRYISAESQALTKTDNYSSALKESQTALIDLIYTALSEFDYSSNFNGRPRTKEDVANDLNSAYANLKALGEQYSNPSSITDDEQARAFITENRDAFNKSMEKIEALYEEYRYDMYTQFSAEIYENAGNNKKNFDEDDFWYYVNLYNQISENGGGIVKISDFNGIDGVGNAANDSDWLQNQIKCGKITIDISTLDSQGKLSFKSTGVSTESSLEYTQTSSIDKAKLAKAEAEYEHKMNEINQKDKKFDMDLNKLETERNALKTEYDSVKKVVQENIERTFGIFS